MTAYSGSACVQMQMAGGKIGFDIVGFTVNKPNIKGAGFDQAGEFFVQTPAGGCLPGVYNGRPAASHLKWVKHGKYSDLVFEGPTSLSGGVLTHTGVWYAYKAPTTLTGTFVLRSTPIRTAAQVAADSREPADVCLIAARNDVGDFRRALEIELEKHGYKVARAPDTDAAHAAAGDTAAAAATTTAAAAAPQQPAPTVDIEGWKAAVARSARVVIILSESLFADPACVQMMEAAIAAKQKEQKKKEEAKEENGQEEQAPTRVQADPIFITYAGTVWAGGATFPPVRLIPTSVRAAFDDSSSESTSASQDRRLVHRLDRFDELADQVRERLGPGSGTPWA